jgi:predicted metal-dependent phosphoesterase TrpH
MLKSDMHLHCKGDPLDGFLRVSPRKLIDVAAEKGFGVISITYHDAMLDDPKLRAYAKKKGIILIPGIEKIIQNKDVLLYNFSQKELDKIDTLEDLKRIKKAHHLVVAPHPFFPVYDIKRFCIRTVGSVLHKYVDVFDAVEFTAKYTKLVSFNRKAVRFAKKHNIPLIANSDSHDLRNFGDHYSLIDSKKSRDSVIRAIKKGRIRIVSRPLFFPRVALIQMYEVIRYVFHRKP